MGGFFDVWATRPFVVGVEGEDTVDTVINFLLHHQSLVILFFILVLFANSIGLSIYKKRHNNQLPPKRATIVISFVLGNIIAFGGFYLGVLASHS